MSLAKLTEQPSRKEYKCGKCMKIIPKGSMYRRWSHRFAPGGVRCMDPKCTPADYEREGNSKRAGLMEAQYLLDKALEQPGLEDIASGVQDAIDAVQGVMDDLQAAVDGWSGTNLEQGEQCQAYEAAVSDLDTWISDAEGWISTLNDLAAEDDESDDDADDDDETREDRVNSALEEITDVPDVEF